MAIHFQLTRKALFHKLPKLPRIEGDVFVLGAAPDPVVPHELLRTATTVSVNASQVSLERYGIGRPDITFLRPGIWDDRDTSTMKRAALRDRSTGLLVLQADTKRRKLKRTFKAIETANYRYDDLVVLRRLDTSKIRNGVLYPRSPFLVRKYVPSMGVRAIFTCLKMGAARVVVAGISLGSSGCSYSDLDYAREHTDDDRAVLRRMAKIGLPVFATNADLADDTGLPLWTGAADAQRLAV